MTVPDVTEKRMLWQQQINSELAEHLVFLDESGININMTRYYGRGLSSERVSDHVPLKKTKSTTVLSSIRLNGEKAFTTFSGGTTGERFLSYLKDILIPTLRSGDIIVMDNMRSHHIKAVRDLLFQHHIQLLYLPPYSPDLNPIEMMWSKMKSILRKWKIRVVNQLDDAVARALALVSRLNCLHWFQHAGYYQ